jgi:tetratricopeptide (TPR) repeat protein
MVALAQRLVAAYLPGEQRDPAGVEGKDWVSLGACYAAQGDAGRAESAYRRALDTIRDDGGRAEAFAHLAGLLKRQERWDEAAAVWELWLTSVPGLDPTPYVELSKYCEWQLTDLERAEMWAAWALHNLTSAPAYQRLPGQIADLEHRLARIRRKRQSPNHPIT